MFNKYLVTGASGFLGRAVLFELKKKGARITALVMNDDPFAKSIPKDVTIIYGDISDDDSLEQFFKYADKETCVIHCAGMVSVASHPGDVIYRINVGGTNNIIRHCEKSGIGKLIYVSSVHAIPEALKNKDITKDDVFSPDLVTGDYAKSKAIATSLVFDSAKRSLNANVVFPSGIIGPGDIAKGSITSMLIQFISGKLHLAVKGGYDFVDVRDVAKGIVECSDRGEPGRGYILSGHYATIKDILGAAKAAAHTRLTVSFLPLKLAGIFAPIYEKRSLRLARPLYFTPCSVSVLGSCSSFNRNAAYRDFGYSPRPVKRSIRDTVLWLKGK